LSEQEYRNAVILFARLMSAKLLDAVNKPRASWVQVNLGVVNVANEVSTALESTLAFRTEAQQILASPLYTVRDLLRYPRRNIPTDNLLLLAAASILELVAAQEPTA
jgi:hypothetical protein